MFRFHDALLFATHSKQAGCQLFKHENRPCAGGRSFAIVRVLLLQRTKSLAESIS
jgi:hypothetical protein